MFCRSKHKPSFFNPHVSVSENGTVPQNKIHRRIERLSPINQFRVSHGIPVHRSMAAENGQLRLDDSDKARPGLDGGALSSNKW